MVAIKSINGTAPPIEPTAYSITKSDLYSDATARSSETGRLIQYPIRLGVYTIELEYRGYDSDISAIEELISGTSFDVEFLDFGGYVTKKMYPSDRSRTTEVIRNGVGRYVLTFSLIEV